MTKTKSTKRALLMSALALLMCVSMLIGSTFAWFTDSVASAGNIIQSGTLDIDLVDAAGHSMEGEVIEFVTVDGRAQSEILWEPGCTYETEPVYVVNKGNLALKYEIAINGITGDAKLLEAIEWTVTIDGVKSDLSKFEGTLIPGETEKSGAIILSGHMKEEAGNEYQDLTVEGISISVVATQLAHESDSFGNNYDKDAVVYDYVIDSSDELKNAFTNGGNILLTDDIELEKITAIEPGAEVYLNLNGKTITVDENTTSNTLIYVKDGAKLTIDGDGTIDLGEVSTMAIFAPYGELVIENGTFIRDKVETVTKNTTGLFMGAKTTASNVTINGGYFDPGYYDANAKDIEGLLAGTVEFTETADDVAKRGNSKDVNLVRVAIKDNVSAILNHSGYGSFKVYGGTFVGANPAWGDEGCMLPTTPNYLRPWSYYQGALLDGQVYDENGVVLPDGYTITRSVNADNVPVYTVTYSK